MLYVIFDLVVDENVDFVLSTAVAAVVVVVFDDVSLTFVQGLTFT